MKQLGAKTTLQTIELTNKESRVWELVLLCSDR